MRSIMPRIRVMFIPVSHYFHSNNQQQRLLSSGHVANIQRENSSWQQRAQNIAGVSGLFLGAGYYFAGSIEYTMDYAKRFTNAVFPKEKPIVHEDIGNKLFDGYKTKVRPYKTEAIANFEKTLNGSNGLITGEPGTGKTVIAELLAQNSTPHVEVEINRRTILIISGSSQEEMYNSMLRRAYELGMRKTLRLPLGEVEDFIVEQCKRRGGQVSIVITCLRPDLGEKGEITIPLYQKFFPIQKMEPYDGDYSDNYSHTYIGEKAVMDNVRFYIAAGKSEVLEALKQTGKFVSFDRKTLFDERSSFTVEDFKNRIEEQNLENLRKKLAESPSVVIGEFIRGICEGHDRLVDIAMAYLEMDGTESIADYCSDLRKIANKEQAILERTLSKIEERGGLMARLILSSIAPQEPAPQKSIMMNDLKSIVANNLNIQPDNKGFEKLYNDSVLALEEFGLIHSDPECSKFYSGLMRSQEKYVQPEKAADKLKQVFYPSYAMSTVQQVVQVILGGKYATLRGA